MKIEKHLQLRVPNTKFIIEISSEDLLCMSIIHELFHPYAFVQEKDFSKDIQIHIDFSPTGILVTRDEVCKVFELEKGNEIGQLCRIVQWVQRGLYPWGLYHGAAVHVDGETVVFLGNSGTGKTTLTTYLLSNCNDIIYLSEDILIVNCEKNILIPYQRPLLLRKDGIKLLQEQYHVCLDHAVNVRYGNYSRYMLRENNVLKKLYPVKCYIKLVRSYEAEEFRLKRIEINQEDVFLSSCYLPADVKNNVLCSMRLAKRAAVLEISYSRLDTFVQNLHNVIKLV